ncbi:hypothetical protein MMC25_007027 [Agyrium rufum]|nr:hypothetical protein [Agyrium rufum]
MMLLDPKHCADLESPSLANFGVALFIIVGIFTSYLPQHHRLISRRTSEGLSPYFVLLGTVSQTYAFANILTLPASRGNMACCSQISGFECFAGLVPIIQLGVQYLCFVFIFFLWILFFPHATALAPPSTLSSSPSTRTAVSVTAVCIGNTLLTFIVSLLVIYLAPSSLQAYANALGIAGTLLACAQYFPQIWTTWRLQSVGSLSIPMMCMQTPGSFVFAASLAANLGWSGWSSWGLFVFTGVLQGVVLVMGLTFLVREKRHKEGLKRIGSADSESSTGLSVVEERSEDGSQEDSGGQGQDERTPLLRE